MNARKRRLAKARRKSSVRRYQTRGGLEYSAKLNVWVKRDRADGIPFAVDRAMKGRTA